MDLSEIAQDLYAVPPDEFIAARKESVAAVRAAGDLALSKAIGELRKPSAAAAVVNLLARHSKELLQEVSDLGDELREAQEHGDGRRLRVLNEERKALLRRVAAECAELAEEHERIDPLRQELRDLQEEATEADADTRGLDRAVAQATKARDVAHKELARAEERLDRLT